MFFTQLRYAVRRLWREPTFTATAVLTLALGVGANVAVFELVEAALLRPLPYPNADELMVVRHRDQRTGITKPFIAMGDYVDLARRQTVFESLGAYGTDQATIFGEGDPFQASALFAAPAMLQMLRFRPLIGRGLTAADAVEGGGQVVILGYELWRTRFGADSAMVGRSVRFASGPRLVIGVAPPGFRFPPDVSTGVIVPMPVPVETPAVRKSGWTFALARRKPGRTAVEATAELDAISRQLATEYPVDNQGSQYYAVPLRDDTVGDAKPALLLLLAAVGVVLLIACVNVANLLVARSLTRHREMAVRMTLGANRWRLVSQLLTESLVLALLAGAAGVAVAGVAARGLTSLAPASLDVSGLGQIALDPTVLGFALVVTVATALACGTVAAVTVPLGESAGPLVVGGRASQTAAARRATTTLVVVEVAFAVVLLIGAGLILRSFAGLLSVDPGFRTDHVLTLELSLPADRYDAEGARVGFYDQAATAIGALPGVTAVGEAVVVPLTGNNWTVPFERADQPVRTGERPPDVGWQVASGGYFRALGIPLRSGRLFDERDRPGSARAVIVSDAIAERFFPGDSAVGHALRISADQTAEIVGVVGDIRRAGLTDEPRADLYFPFERQPSTGITLFVRTSDGPARLAGPVQAALRKVEPNVVLTRVRTMAEIALRSMRLTTLVLWLLGVFAALALVLAAIGIYGVMSEVVRQRSREIGTRMALGAPRSGILWMVARMGLSLAGIGTAVGLAIGLAGARALRGMLYGVSAGDPLVLLGATGMIFFTAAAACYLPARRAASVDPARTLAEP